MRTNIKGQRFGRWLVIEHVESGKWLCECDCGQQKLLHHRWLRYGKSKSCGCLAEEKRLGNLAQSRGTVMEAQAAKRRKAEAPIDPPWNIFEVWPIARRLSSTPAGARSS